MTLPSCAIGLTMRVFVKKQKLTLNVVCVHRRPWSSPFKTGRGGGVCTQVTRSGDQYGHVSGFI